VRPRYRPSWPSRRGRRKLAPTSGKRPILVCEREKGVSARLALPDSLLLRARQRQRSARESSTHFRHGDLGRLGRDAESAVAGHANAAANCEGGLVSGLLRDARKEKERERRTDDARHERDDRLGRGREEVVLRALEPASAGPFLLLGRRKSWTHGAVLLVEEAGRLLVVLLVLEVLHQGCETRSGPGGSARAVGGGRERGAVHAQTTSPPAQKCLPAPLMRTTLASSLASMRCRRRRRRRRRGSARTARPRLKERTWAHLEVRVDEVDHLVVERVEGLGPVEGDAAQSVHRLELDRRLRAAVARRRVSEGPQCGREGGNARRRTGAASDGGADPDDEGAGGRELDDDEGEADDESWAAICWTRAAGGLIVVRSEGRQVARRRGSMAR